MKTLKALIPHLMSHPRAWAAAALLAGYALSMVNLTAQSIWVDEGFTWFAVQQELLPLLRSDAHPPLYFALMRAWTLLAGDSALAMRFFSVLMGALALTLTARLGWLLVSRADLPPAGRWLAPAAVLLMALSDMFVYIAQEARPYTFHIVLALLAAYAMLRAENSSQRRWWGLWALAGLALLYTQYYGAWWLLVQGGYVLVCWRGARRISGLALLVAVGAAFLPWALGMILPYQLAAAGAHTRTDTSDLATLGRYLTAYFSGQWPMVFGIAGVGLAAALGWRQPRMRHGRRHVLWLWAAFVVPVLLTFILNAFSARLLYDYRLSQIVPACALAVALGWVWFSRGVRTFLLLVMAVYGLLYVDAYRYKEDWRGMSAAIAAHVLPNDGVVVDFGGGDFQLTYYLRDDLPPGVPMMALRQVILTAPERYETDTLAFMDARDVLWLARWNDSPDALNRLALTGHIPTATIPIATHSGMNLILYRYERPTGQPLVSFENGMSLLKTDFDAATLRAALTWQAAAALPQDYTTSVLLLDAAGAVAAQLDSPPTPPTTHWLPGRPYYEGKTLTALQPLAPGTYRLVVQVYTWAPDGLVVYPPLATAGLFIAQEVVILGS
jgi:hypothetical protein